MIGIIAALTQEGVIGRGNEMPWDIKEERDHFRQLTEGTAVVMGRRTYESIGQALVNRHNIVVSDQPLDAPGCTVCSSLNEALERAKAMSSQVFIIGGADVYQQSLPLADRLYLSYIKYSYTGDVFFPPFSKDDWEPVTKENHEQYTFITFKRKIYECT